MTGCVHKVRWSVKRPEDCRFRLSVSHYKDRIVAPDEYTGSTEVTPSSETQTLQTKDRLVREDITVEGITGTQVTTENGEYDVVGDKSVVVDVWPTEYSDDIDDFSGGNVLALISHAQEYINTGYYPKITTEYYIKAHKTTNYQRYENLFSALFYDIDVRIGAQFIERSLSEVRFYYTPTSNSGSINTTISNEPTILSTRCPFLEVSSAQELSHIATHPLLIFFGYYRNGYDTYKGGYNFYGLKCYENKKLIKKYVPWLDENNVPCVHELVNDEYFYNVGTGAFGYIDLEGNTHDA